MREEDVDRVCEAPLRTAWRSDDETLPTARRTRQRQRIAARCPDLSVVIPVYNEEQVLPPLFARLYPALDALGRSYEIVFVNDGSRDRSAALLREAFDRRPDVTRVVLFAANFGQHRAILAGFA